MNRNEARELFSQSGISLSQIGSKEIYKLRELIKEELSKFNNSGFEMSLTGKMRTEYNNEGTVTLCEIRAKGTIYKKQVHFKDREALTINYDGFIGFAGWADSRNVSPFINAFIKWIESIDGQTIEMYHHL